MVAWLQEKMILRKIETQLIEKFRNLRKPGSSNSFIAFKGFGLGNGQLEVKQRSPAIYQLI